MGGIGQIADGEGIFQLLCTEMLRWTGIPGWAGILGWTGLG
jgi:hypothetical protein